MNMTWKKLKADNDVWKPLNINDFLEGVIIDKCKDAAYGTYFVVSHKNGEFIKTPFHRVLQNVFDSNELKVGDRIKIVYTGSKNTGKGSPAMIYEVSKWVEVSA